MKKRTRPKFKRSASRSSPNISAAMKALGKLARQRLLEPVDESELGGSISPNKSNPSQGELHLTTVERATPGREPLPVQERRVPGSDSLHAAFVEADDNV